VASAVRVAGGRGPAVGGGVARAAASSRVAVDLGGVVSAGGGGPVGARGPVGDFAHLRTPVADGSGVDLERDRGGAQGRFLVRLWSVQGRLGPCLVRIWW